MIKAKLNRSAIELALYERNISQNSLAYKIGISRGYMSQLLAGTRCASPKLRQRFISVLKLSQEQIFLSVPPKTHDQAADRAVTLDG